jgi:hypothetical protein
MPVNGEWILSGLVSLWPVLASHLTLEFMVIAPCREIPSLVPFPSQLMSSSSNETRSRCARDSLNGLSLPTTTAMSDKASNPGSSPIRCCIYGKIIIKYFHYHHLCKAGSRGEMNLNHSLWILSKCENLNEFKRILKKLGAHSSVVGWGTMLQAGRSRVQVTMRWNFKLT